MAKKTTAPSAASAPKKRIPGWMKISFSVVLVLVLVAFFSEVELGEKPRGIDANIKNVLLVTFDTTRADRIGAYGYTKAKTENLDRLASEGVLFERCITVAPITLPSHTSILTGQYPYRHGVRNNGTHNVMEEVTTIAEILSDKGFSTGAVVSALVLDSRYGLDQGFDSYNDDLSEAEKAPLFMYRETKAQNTSERAIRWLQDRTGERWFLWVHYFDPHANYQPPEPFASACEDPYDGEIHYADAGLGEVLESLRKTGVLEETLVIVTADHGESLGEHGEATHSLFIYDATTRVPFIMWHPALAKNKRVRLPVSSVDIAPTVLDLLGFEPAAHMDGDTLANVVLDERLLAPDKAVYSESMNPYYNHGWADMRAVRDRDFRYVRAPKAELYDIVRDGRELNNMLEDLPDLVEHYEGTLDGFLLPHMPEKDSRGDDIKNMSADERAALMELGYVWTDDAGGDLDEDRSDLPDPKDKVGMWERSQRAHDLVRQKRIREAEEALREVLEEDPGATLTQSALVGVLLQNGKREEAIELLKSIVNGPAPPITSILRLAGLEHDDGVEGWEAHLTMAKAIAPLDPLPWIRQGDWAQQDEDPEAALVAYNKALEIDSSSAQAYIGIGNTEHRRKNFDEAEKALRKATELDPLAFEAFYNLGVVTEGRGRSNEAEQWYLKALRIEKDHVLTLVNLANLYFQRSQAEPGRIDPQLVAQAEGLYRKAVENGPEDFNANFNLGVLLLRTAPILKDPEQKPARFREAANAFGICAQRFPDRQAPWRNRMIACRNAGDMNFEMLEAANQLLKIVPEDKDGLLFHAIALERGGKAAEADNLMQGLIAADSDDFLKQRGGRDAELRTLLSRNGMNVDPITQPLVPMNAGASLIDGVSAPEAQEGTAQPEGK